ncbi:MAG: branched-chain amino acid ABC transporter permease, partial [Jatrophihabitans sp.]
MDSVLSSLGFGIVTASILLPAAVGFTLQFSATGVLNIAFGAQMTFAAYVAYIGTHAGLGIWWAACLAGVFGAVSSMLLNRFLLTPFMRRGTNFFGMVVVAIALALLIEYVVEVIWGPLPVSYQVSASRVWHLGPMMFTRSQVIVIGISVVFAVATHTLLRYTRVGKAIRAVADNRNLARSSGISAQRMTDLAWLLSGLMGGAAGVMLGISLSSVSYTMGDTFLMEIIAAAILGGVGQVYGAM